MDSVYWLLEICLRYSFDCKTDNLQKATVSFVREDTSGQTCLNFKHGIHASTKNVSYNIEIIVKSYNILISSLHVTLVGMDMNASFMCIDWSCFIN